jgi:hypothetical protein
VNSVPSVAKAPEKARSFTHRLQARDPIRPIRPIRPIEIGIGIGIDPRSGWLLALMYRSNFATEWCRHRNNTVAVPGVSWPNPITRPFDTDTDTDPDPDLASP